MLKILSFGSRRTREEPHAEPAFPGQQYGDLGYADDEATWIDGMGRRLDVANNFAERVAGRIDPNYIMETVLASTMSGEVTQAVARAESRQQALALLFMAPEFQRR